MTELDLLILCVATVFMWDLARSFFKHKEVMASLGEPETPTPKDKNTVGLTITITSKIKKPPKELKEEVKEESNKDLVPISQEYLHDYVTFFPHYEGPTTFLTEGNRVRNKKSPYKRTYATWHMEEDVLLQFLVKTLYWDNYKISQYLQRSPRGVESRRKYLNLC